MTTGKKAKASSGKKTAVQAKKRKPSSCAGKPAARKTGKRSASIAGAYEVGTIAKEQLIVQPGAPAGNIPPVEEPAAFEEAVGVVTHYYSDLGVAVVQVNKGVIRTNDRIRIRGHTTDLTQMVGSMEYEHQHVDQAEAGQSIGIKVFDHTRAHDIVYLVK
jgi:hypothetical protein